MSKNNPDYAMGVDSFNWGKITNRTGIFQHFKVKRSLCGDADSVSLESVKSPGRYLRQTKNNWLLLDEITDDKSKRDASFHPIMNKFNDVRC